MAKNGNKQLIDNYHWVQGLRRFTPKTYGSFRLVGIGFGAWVYESGLQKRGYLHAAQPTSLGLCPLF